MTFLRPLPGNPADVEKGAGALSDTAQRIFDCADTLQTLVDGEGGTSKGLAEAIQKARKVLPRLRLAGERYDVAGAALAEFAVDQAAAIEAADAAISRWEEATERLGTLRFREVDEGDEGTHEASLDDARAEQADAEADYWRAKGDFDDAAERADRRIEDIVEDSKLNDGRFDDLKGALEDIADFAADVAEVIGELLTALAGLSIALAPLWLPQPLGLALLALNVLRDHPGDVSEEVQENAIKRWYADPDYQRRVVALHALASNAYKRPGDDGYAPPEPWERMTEGALRLHGITVPDDDGFSATVYRNPATGEIVVAYRGTEPTADPYNDVTEDLINAGGLDSSQGEQAVDLATQVVDAFGADNVEFTGHSLGGGLAAQASVATGAEATTFNAAGIGDGNYNHAAEAYGDGASADHVVNFNTDNDPLTNIQELTGNTPPAGAQIDIESTSPDWQVWAGHGTGQFDFDGDGKKG